MCDVIFWQMINCQSVMVFLPSFFLALLFKQHWIIIYEVAKTAHKRVCGSKVWRLITTSYIHPYTLLYIRTSARRQSPQLLSHMISGPNIRNTPKSIMPIPVTILSSLLFLILCTLPYCSSLLISLKLFWLEIAKCLPIRKIIPPTPAIIQIPIVVFSLYYRFVMSFLTLSLLQR